MKKNKNIFVDKTYKLTKDKAPLSYTIPSRNTKRKSLLYFDDKTEVNRSLRYAKNQKRIFLNSTVLPSELSSLSTLRISLAETLYCLPPVCITAKDIVLISYMETGAI